MESHGTEVGVEWLLYKQPIFSLPGTQDWRRRRMEGFFPAWTLEDPGWYYFGNYSLRVFRHTSEAKVQILTCHLLGSRLKDAEGILYLSRYQEKPEKTLYP